MSFYTDLFLKVDSVMTSFVTAKSAAVIGGISSVATTLFIIYVALWGLAMMRGMIQEPVLDAAFRMVKVGLIIGIALSVGRYQTYVSSIVWNLPDAIASLVMSGPARTGAGLLDRMHASGMDVGDKIWQQISITSGVGTSLGYFLMMVVVYCATALLTVGAGALYLTAKIALAILLALGPLFIVLLLFRSTQRFFEAWFSQVATMVFIVALTAASVALVYAVIETFVDDLLSLPLARLTEVFGLLVLGILTLVVMIQIPSIAGGLGHGIAVSSMGIVGRMLGKSYRSTFGLQPYLDRNNTLRHGRGWHRARNFALKSADTARTVAGPPARAARMLYRRIPGSAPAGPATGTVDAGVTRKSPR